MQTITKPLSFKEAARILGIDRVSISAIVDANGIPSGDMGTARYLDQAAFEQLRPLAEAFKARRSAG